MIELFLLNPDAVQYDLDYHSNQAHSVGLSDAAHAMLLWPEPGRRGGSGSRPGLDHPARNVIRSGKAVHNLDTVTARLESIFSRVYFYGQARHAAVKDL